MAPSRSTAARKPDRGTSKGMTTNTIFAAAQALDDDFKLFSGKPPEEQHIVDLEEKLGRALHPEHRALIAAVGALAVVAKDEVWPPPQPYEIRPYWQMLRGIELLGPLPPNHPLSVLGARQRVPDGMVPMGKVVGADRHLCATAENRVVWCTRDGVEEASGFEAEVLAFLTQLASDKDRVKRDGIQRS